MDFDENLNAIVVHGQTVAHRAHFRHKIHFYRVSNADTRYWYSNFVCPSVCMSVCCIPVSMKTA